jgi:hypothetical protein
MRHILYIQPGYVRMASSFPDLRPPYLYGEQMCCTASLVSTQQEADMPSEVR